MAKPLTLEEKDQIRKYWLEGDTVFEIEEKTGRSHTTINRITKGIPRPSTRSHRQFKSTATSTEMSTRAQVPLPQKKTNIPPPSGSYNPYQASYHSEPDQDQYPSSTTPMDSPSMTYSQDPWWQEFQQDKERRNREHEEWRALGKQISEV
jgi:hypothetical protein